MPEYKYKCSACSKEYSEIRDISHPQFQTNCDLCGAEYVERAE